jgi:hypothetical protein
MSRALGLNDLIPSSLLAGRWIAVLVCYLDDSGKDPQNRITTLAGYVADEDQWRAFEREVDPIFERAGINILNTKHLHRTEGEFEDWSGVQKQDFIVGICPVMSRHLRLGISLSAVKETWKAKKNASQGKIQVSAYGFCFNVIVDWILTDVRVGRAAHTEGVAFVLEAGHENNPDAERCFNAVRKQHKLEHALRSICFVPKESCRAIQVADMLAFYSRRHGVAMEQVPLRERHTVSPGVMMNFISGSVPHRGFVMTDFHRKNELPF